MDTMYTEELTIDLVDLVFYFLKKWKSMIAALLVVAILGAGFAAMQPETEEVEQKEIPVPAANILANMEDAYRIRVQYETLLEKCMEMDPSEDVLTYDAMLASAGRYNTIMQALEKTFTGDNLTYYQENFLGMASTNTEAPAPAKAPEYAKFTVIGAFLGVVLWGLWYLVAYFANSAIKTAEELSSGMGITLLGRIATEKKAKGIDKLLAGWQEKGKRPEASVSYVAAVIDGAQEGQVALCGDQSADAVKDLMTQLEKACPKAKASGWISESEEALKLAKQVQGEILVVRTWDTKRAQVRRELEMCRVQNVKILGMIVID